MENFGMISQEDGAEGRGQMEFLSLMGRLAEDKDIATFCKDSFNSDVSAEHGHLQQLRTFVKTAKHDAREAGVNTPEGFDYLLIALIGKDMLNRSHIRDQATVLTSIALAFRCLKQIEIDETGTAYRTAHNCAIFNVRNKLAADWFNNNGGIWALINNNISVERQIDKIHGIKKEIDFSSQNGKPLLHDIFLLKTKNVTSRFPNHFILWINNHCFHLTNVGLFSGEYRRLKAQLFHSVVSFDRVGRTSLDMTEIDVLCGLLASQSHSLLFNNCQNYAKNVYDAICEEKGVRVEISSFSGTTVIIQVLLAVIAILFLFVIRLVFY